MDQIIGAGVMLIVFIVVIFGGLSVVSSASATAKNTLRTATAVERMAAVLEWMAQRQRGGDG